MLAGCNRLSPGLTAVSPPASQPAHLQEEFSVLRAPAPGGGLMRTDCWAPELMPAGAGEPENLHVYQVPRWLMLPGWGPDSGNHQTVLVLEPAQKQSPVTWLNPQVSFLLTVRICVSTVTDRRRTIKHMTLRTSRQQRRVPSHYPKRGQL